MESLVTVILPIYNMEAYLARCLDSVCASTYGNLEIICVDDGSKDRSLEILREYEARDSRIVVIAKENGGVSSARNAGLDRMHGEFVTFVDPDDLIHPRMIELLYRAAEETKADIAICNYATVHDEDFPLTMPSIEAETNSPRIVDWLTVFKNYYHGAFCWGRLISSSVIAEKRFPEELRIGEDSVFFTSLWDQEKPLRCCVLDNPLYFYYVRTDSLSSRVNSKQRIDVVYRFLDQQSAVFENGKNVNFVFAVTRLLRHIKYYSGSRNCDKAAVKHLARIMRKQSFRVLRAPWFTGKEKLYYLIKAFFPHLKTPKAFVR